MSKKSKSKQQQRKRRRRREERGLPSDKALRELAKTYLENQRRLWPELAKNGELPQLTDKIVGEMAAKYRKTFLGKQVEPFAHSVFAAAKDVYRDSGLPHEESENRPRYG